MRLKNKNIIITGAASGIGMASAKMFYKEGARLLLADINETDGLKLANDLPGTKFIRIDVTNQKEVSNLFSVAKKLFTKIDGLFHTAGIESSYNLIDCSENHFDEIINVHLKGTFLCLQEAARAMLNTGGSIVLTASQKGITGSCGSIAYNAAKGGIVIMGKSAALELGKYGIRVNILCPGATDTPMLHRDLQQQPESRNSIEDLIKNYPLGRIGTAQEIAYGALYLISDESSFVTGTTLVIDGGNTAG